ncbi:hypothetical protein SAMN04489716_3959 [Actinoplanes derwentensis]|uniref:Uncharacterized protein n=2 Tax=Actinoplanes derwentensis TaxID=113562 RepID=A0A1H2AMW2_9ACTN|nr:hypothetical protein Ade03nite_82130 [Actinoplanes derwentensis]SDT47112.1 hypothetical protein SAMN04489716_3959 [Actinoplanes derwentensis]
MDRGLFPGSRSANVAHHAVRYVPATARKDLMSGNGPPAHRAAGPAQRNRIIAVGAGLLLALILLFSLLAFCTDIGGDDPPIAGPGSNSPYPPGTSPGNGGPGSSPGTGGPSNGNPGTSPSNGGPGSGGPGSSPGNGDPGTSSPGTSSPGTSSPGTSDPGPGPGNGEPGTGSPSTGPGNGDNGEPTTGPGKSPTPSGGVDAGGGGEIPGRRMALLVTGVFLLLTAASAAAYAIRRPLHHR